MKTRQDVLAAALVAAAFGCVLLGSPRPAAAGVVKVEGSTVVFTAGNNEVNTIVINARGSAFDPATGQTVPGFSVIDSTAPISAGPGCRRLAPAVICDLSNPSFIALDLGDRNDQVSQEEREPGDAVPMRVKGGSGNDTLRGGPRGDVLDGGIDDDTLDGGDGNDTLEGGFGTDTITGGRGTDAISAGPAKDTILAADGERDTINCGLGRDSVTADAVDTKKRCN